VVNLTSIFAASLRYASPRLVAQMSKIIRYVVTDGNEREIVESFLEFYSCSQKNR